MYNKKWASACCLPAGGDIIGEGIGEEAGKGIVRVHLRGGVELKKASFPEITALHVKIKLLKGESHFKRIDVPRGHPQNPMTHRELAEKFRDCATPCTWPMNEDNLSRPVGIFVYLEKLEDLSPLI
jgi:2-methylcitrate dehydratase PrpD